MPQHRQPRSLLALCISTVAKEIISQSANFYSKSTGGIMSADVEVARREFVSSYPGTVHVQLLEEVDRLLSVAPIPPKSGVLSNIAAAMLLSPNVQQLHIKLCCPEGCSHQETLLSLLAQEGAGLKTLKLALPDLTTLEPALLQQALIRPVALTQLYLPKICTDAHLQIIGSTCRNLSHLNVLGSKRVTDEGLSNLFIKIKFPFVEDITSYKEPSPCLDPSCRNDCKLIRLLLKIFSWMHWSRESNELMARLYHVIHCWKQETELCKSLRVLDIGETSVTPRGVVMALMKAPHLHSFHTYMNVGSAVEVFDSCWRAVNQNSVVDFPKFGLKSVVTLHITEPQLVLLSNYLPSLSSLAINNPHFEPQALNLLPLELNTLIIRKVKFEGLWATELNSLGNIPQRRNLHSLSLCSYPTEGTQINLCDLFQSCPNIGAFRGVGMRMNWVQGTNGSNVSMTHLRYLTVGHAVDKETVVEVLMRCPNLEVAHFDRCLDLTDRDIMKVMNPISKNLKCFYVCYAPRLTKQAVSVIQTAYEKLSSIGNLSQWGILNEDLLKIKRNILENNWNLKLANATHLLDSFCGTTA